MVVLITLLVAVKKENKDSFNSAIVTVYFSGSCWIYGERVVQLTLFRAGIAEAQVLHMTAALSVFSAAERSDTGVVTAVQDKRYLHSINK
jgi:hypothetical protein